MISCTSRASSLSTAMVNAVRPALSCRLQSTFLFSRSARTVSTLPELTASIRGGAISRGPKVGVVDIDQVDRLSISLPEGIA